MTAKGLHKIGQYRDAVIFVVLSSFIILGAIIYTEYQGNQGYDELNINSTGIRSEQNDNKDIPDKVLQEATRLANKEWDYIQKTFPERNYSKYRLESVDHVLTCHDIENEIFDIYGITCSYQSSGHENWEQAENAAGSYLIFRNQADGTIEWIGDISTYYEPGSEEFENDVHDVLMYADEQYIFKLLANDSLEQMLEETLNEYLSHLIPGDYIYFGWKQLAQEAEVHHGQVYGVLLFHTHSGSPLIYSEQTDQYVAAIYSTYLLPIRVTYQKDEMNRYVVTDLWEPSEENYGRDVRENFPSETADLILNQLDQCAIDILEKSGATEGDAVFEFFPGGPVWPTYSFSDALDNATLCSLADYYQDGDIYCKPVRGELIRRFCNDPVGLLNGLGACDENTQNTVCSFIVKADIQVECDPEIRTHLTDKGEIVYEKLENLYVGMD